MQLISAAFSHKSFIPDKYTCNGENISPPLEFLNIPEGVTSFALIVDDPDAPSKTWVHWVVWNIPATTKQIADGSVPEGAIEGITDFGSPGYGGPCPPSGTHRYFFKLYALDTLLDLPATTAKEELLRAMEGHVITQAELIGLYSKK